MGQLGFIPTIFYTLPYFNNGRGTDYAHHIGKYVPTNFKTIPQGLRKGLVPNALNDAATANSLIERANFPIKNLNRPVGAHGLKVPKALLKRKIINEFS